MMHLSHIFSDCTVNTSCIFFSIVYRMAFNANSNLEEFKEEGHSAFVLGYTGEVGKELVKELKRTKPFKKVYLIGRRQVNLGADIGPEFVRFL